MRAWSCKEAGRVLGISPTKTTQSLFAPGAAFEKIARLMLADPQRTLADLAVTMCRLRPEAPPLVKT
jgi:hypothetical protein